ncbi:replication-relaxation family protein [Bacillus infantis]|uniref:replication-relaxation family protein n=1 Tax=Bacillus infantis TaxID=324767 RepID=UPI0020A15FF6|nr:replication-relaxation family protein [Bacillus infantis]MCP1161422.1 replication-relaxation family protein [Bacillus infantis]
MPIIQGYSLTPKQLKIMHWLFKSRAATVEQITRGLGYSNKSYKAIYNLMLDLRKQKLIDSDDLKYTHKHLYYLKEDGHYLMNSVNNIEPYYRGTGFSNDLGHFPYELYKYPQKQREHHGMLIDLSLEVEDFNRWVENKKTNIHSEYENAQEDEHIFSSSPVLFRDNLYASQEFTLELNKKRNKYFYRPDGEIRIKEKTYALEIDRSTERNKGLKEKFLGYKRYFDFLSQKGLELPKAIVFVTENKTRQFGMKHRWDSITNSFFSQIGDYKESVNLVLLTMNKVKSFLFKECTLSVDRLEHVQSALQNLKEQGDVKYGTSLKWMGDKEKQYPFVVSKNEGKPHLNPVIRVEGYETLGWVQAILFKQRNDELHIEKHGRLTNNSTPLFYYLYEKPSVIGVTLIDNYREYFTGTSSINIKNGIYEEMHLPPNKSKVDTY